MDKDGEVIKYLERLLCSPNFKLEDQDVEVINKFLEYGYFDDEILELINLENIILEGLKLPKTIYMKKEFINRYLKLYDIDTYRNNIEHLKLNNIGAYEFITRNMQKRYDYIVESISDEGIFSEYQELYDKFLKKQYVSIQYPKVFFKLMELYSKNQLDDNKAKELLIEGTNRLMLDCMIDKYFEDFSTNVLINIRSIVELNKKYHIIPVERLQMYNRILNFFSLNIAEKKKLYNELTLNYRELLYDDFRICRNYIYNMYNESFIDLNKMDYMEKESVRIYELNGQEFYIPIHMASWDRRNIKCGQIWENKNNMDTISLSIISNEHLGTYQNVRKYIAFGFNKLNINNIMHLYPEDSYSKSRNYIPKVNMLYAPKELIDETDLYNEMLVIEDESIKPDYLICYDEIIQEDYILAISMNIPIVLIDTNSYEKNIKIKRNKREFYEQYIMYS